MKRRDFLKTAAAAGAAAALGTGSLSLASCAPQRKKGGGKMELSWYPYELELQHTFTVASYSRNSTPGV